MGNRLTLLPSVPLYNYAAPFQSSRNQLRSREAPWGLSKMLEHLRTKYMNPPVVIYENGKANLNSTQLSAQFLDNFN
jgi:hypothetical protein